MIASSTPAVLRSGFWPVLHGPVSADAYTDTSVSAGPVYLPASDVAQLRLVATDNVPA